MKYLKQKHNKCLQTHLSNSAKQNYRTIVMACLVWLEATTRVEKGLGLSVPQLFSLNPNHSLCVPLISTFVRSFYRNMVFTLFIYTEYLTSENNKFVIFHSNFFPWTSDVKLLKFGFLLRLFPHSLHTKILWFTFDKHSFLYWGFKTESQDTKDRIALTPRQ